MSRSRYLQSDLGLLWGWAAARCAYPGCRCELAAPATEDDNAVPIGEIAHIVGSSDKGPRGMEGLPGAHRDKYENLILLCPTHHTLVDKQVNSFTVDDLKGWKREHERWVRERLSEEMSNVGFAELEILTRGLLNAPAAVSVDFIPLAPAEKMAKNHLTSHVGFELTMGLSKAAEVKRFVSRLALIDQDFPERVKAGFMMEYRRRRELGSEGDALFQGLAEFAAMGRRELRFRAAGLAVLAYLFEACEVFER